MQNNLQLGPTINYDTDLFGRIRREVEGATASAQQSADDLANARLVLTTDLATDYFSLRELDAEIDVLNRSVKLQQKALDYVTAEHDLGSVSGLDVLQQKSLLDSTRVQAQLLLNQRAQFEHAIAALVGVPAPQFAIEAKVLDTQVPPIPLGLPSDVLATPPGHCIGGARHGRGERADRRRQGGVLPEPDADAGHRLGKHAVRRAC